MSDSKSADARRAEILLKYSREVLNLVDRDLRIVYRSSTAAQPLGYADGLVGHSALEVIHPDDHPAAFAALGKLLEAPGAVARAIVRAKHADGSWRILDAVATNLLDLPEINAILLEFRDITEERQAEDRLFAASRLASLGTLAAGVGHEINNPLTYVIANLDRALELLLESGSGVVPQPISGETFALIAEAREGAQRIAKIVGELKLLSAPERDELVAVDLDAAAERALTIVGNQLRARARVVKRLGKAPRALAAESRIVQVLIDLLINAAHAIPAGALDGKIQVATSSRGDEVVVRVEDNGCGMPESLKEHIFEPYLTTKSGSGGSGLGLWVVQRIVHSFGGRIEVVSEPGRGSTFSVVLPRAPAQEAQAPLAGIRVVPAGKRGRVLVVDDERLVARALARVLERFHDVAMASSGAEVLDRLKKGERWDAIVSDLVMPGMDGLELRQRAMEIDPELARRFVFVSGGAFEEHVRAGLAQLGIDYFAKPLDFGELRAAVAKLVD